MKPHRRPGNPPARELTIDVAVVTEAAVGTVGVGYWLDGAPYTVTVPPAASHADAHHAASGVATQHALHLGYSRVRTCVNETAHDTHPLVMPSAPTLARFALALHALARDGTLSERGERALRAVPCLVSPASLPSRTAGHVRIHADGSFDPQDALVSLGYTLAGQPFAVAFQPGAHANGTLAEREAIRVALQHAMTLEQATLTVATDHLFHVRRYRETLVHRGRRKSASLERLDALVDTLGARVTFEYAATRDEDAPHRLALHARALARLARGQTLSNAQRSALRRVHYALRSSTPVPY